MKVLNFCVSVLSLVLAPAVLHAASSDDLAPSIEGVKYLCTGEGIKIEAHIKSRLENDCNGQTCAYQLDLFVNNEQVKVPYDKNGNRPIALSLAFAKNEWGIMIWGPQFQLVSMFLDGKLVKSDLSSIPFFNDGIRYPTVSCSLAKI